MSMFLLQIWQIQYLGTAVTNQNYTHETTQASSALMMMRYNSAKKLSYFILPSKNVKIQLHKTRI
jgi:hypothetical protein